MSAAVALPSSGVAKRAPIAAASCAPLTLAPGKAGLLKLTPKKGSLKIVASQLAPGVKPATKQRKITRVRATAYRFAFRVKKGARGERVRLLVSFGSGKKVLKKRVVACTVRVGQPTRTLTVTVSGPGSVTTSPGGLRCTAETSPCSRAFKPGTKVRLTAAPENLADFGSWNGACKGNAACTVTLSANRTVGAGFAKKRFQVAVQKAGEGGGTVTATDGAIACGATCTDTVEAGTIMRLRAEADGNSRFVGWSGVCSSTVTLCVFIVDGAQTITATFEKQGHRMAVSRAGDGGGTIAAQGGGIDCGATCTFTYPAGTPVTLTATPDSTSLLAGWIGDCTPSGNTCTTTMDKAKFIAASFARGVTITVAVNTEHPTAAGTGAGTIVSEPAGINCGPAGSGATACSALFFPDAIVRLKGVPSDKLRDWYRCQGETVQPGPGNCEGLGSELGGRTIVAHFNP